MMKMMVVTNNNNNDDDDNHNYDDIYENLDNFDGSVNHVVTGGDDCAEDDGDENEINLWKIQYCCSGCYYPHKENQSLHLREEGTCIEKITIVRAEIWFMTLTLGIISNS